MASAAARAAALGLICCLAAAAPATAQYASNLVIFGDSITDWGILAIEQAFAGEPFSQNPQWWYKNRCPKLPGLPSAGVTCYEFTEAGGLGNWVHKVQKVAKLSSSQVQNLAIGGAAACPKNSNLGYQLALAKAPRKGRTAVIIQLGSNDLLYAVPGLAALTPAQKSNSTYMTSVMSRIARKTAACLAADLDKGVARMSAANPGSKDVIFIAGMEPLPYIPDVAAYADFTRQLMQLTNKEYMRLVDTANAKLRRARIPIQVKYVDITTPMIKGAINPPAPITNKGACISKNGEGAEVRCSKPCTYLFMDGVHYTSHYQVKVIAPVYLSALRRAKLIK